MIWLLLISFIFFVLIYPLLVISGECFDLEELSRNHFEQREINKKLRNVR